MHTWSHHLNSELEKRKGRNPLYGLRAFARDLHISPAQLSQMISGQRPISRKMVDRLAKELALAPAEQRLLSNSPSKKEKRTLEEDQFQVIAHWIHFALLSLAETSSNKSDVRWLARRFGVQVGEIRGALERLQSLGLLEIRNDRLLSTTTSLQTSSDIASASIRRSHKQHLILAEQKLEEVPIELREFTTITMAVNPAKLKQAKTLIKNFKRELEELLETGNKSEVYTLALQLYPLTKVNSEI